MLGRPGYRAVDAPDHGHQSHAAGLQERKELDQFGRGATLGHGHHDIVIAHHSEVTVQGIRCMQERCRGARAVQGCDRLSGDIGTLADASKNQPSSSFPPLENKGDNVVKVLPDPAFEGRNRRCLKAQGALRRITPGSVLGRRW
jgi:hypothetical protein